MKDAREVRRETAGAGTLAVVARADFASDSRLRVLAGWIDFLFEFYFREDPLILDHKIGEKGEGWKNKCMLWSPFYK